MSVSTTTSYEIGYATTSRPRSTTNQYGISTTNIYPASQQVQESSDSIIFDSSSPRIETSSHTGVGFKTLEEYQEESQGEIDGISLGLDPEDPFANYDWKKDSSSGVTATFKTTYETRFGFSGPRTNRRPASVILSNPRIKTETKNATQSSNLDSLRDRRRIRPRSRITRLSTPAPEHKAFSNFRYYKTAFGRSESVSTSDGNSSASSSRIFPNYRSLRPEKTASFNTRYSKYGRQNA